MSNPDQDFQQTTELITGAFGLFDDRASDMRQLDRAHLMMDAARASATLLLVKEQRVANLVALASVPEYLQVDPALTREALETAALMMGLVEDEPGLTPEQMADLFDNDPADKDVTK